MGLFDEEVGVGKRLCFRGEGVRGGLVRLSERSYSILKARTGTASILLTAWITVTNGSVTLLCFVHF